MKKSSTLLNLEQKKAVRHAEGPLIIIAGAGTGKTTVITERVKYLLSKNAEVNVLDRFGNYFFIHFISFSLINKINK